MQAEKTAESQTATKAQNIASGSAFEPLSVAVFRWLWLASIVSTTGAMMQGVGEAWLVTNLSPSPLVVSLIQVAASLPIFLLALPAGAIADVVDRRKLLLWAQSATFAVACLYALLVFFGWINVWSLLALSFLLGAGGAVSTPAMMAAVPEMLPGPEVPRGITLNNVVVNIARAIGPPVGGLLVASAGAWTVFAFNALTFSATLIALYSWEKPARQSRLPRERIFNAMIAGARFARHSPPLRASLVRTAAFVFCASAIWSLFPLYVRQELGLGVVGYGVLFGLVGAGALVGAAFLPVLRRLVSIDLMLMLATILIAVVMFALARVRDANVVGLIVIGGGAVWLVLVASFAVVSGGVAPMWVKARALAVHVLVFQGAMVAGSLVWGAWASRYGIDAALTVAAIGLVLGLPLAAFFRLQKAEGLNVQPSLAWAAPNVALESEQQKRYPVMVTVEYFIELENAAGFEAVMREVETERRRNGAIFWELFFDPENQRRHVEVFIVESWEDHLRGHGERVTVADLDIHDRARAFHTGSEPPLVTHLVGERLKAGSG